MPEQLRDQSERPRFTPPDLDAPSSYSPPETYVAPQTTRVEQARAAVKAAAERAKPLASSVLEATRPIAGAAIEAAKPIAQDAVRSGLEDAGLIRTDKDGRTKVKKSGILRALANPTGTARKAAMGAGKELRGQLAQTGRDVLKDQLNSHLDGASERGYSTGSTLGTETYVAPAAESIPQSYVTPPDLDSADRRPSTPPDY